MTFLQYFPLWFCAIQSQCRPIYFDSDYSEYCLILCRSELSADSAASLGILLGPFQPAQN